MVDSPAALRHTMRRLAGWSSEAGVLSAYLDLRPHATDNPNVRSGLIVLRDRLRQIERSQDVARETLAARAERVDEEIERRMPDVHGLTVFAGGELGVEVAETRLPLDDEVVLESRPRLLPLARLADAEQAVVALVDTNTLRLFVQRSGALEEVGLVDDDTHDYRRTAKGGWAQARFGRHVEAHRDAFTKLAAEAVGQVVELEGATVVLLAGDEVAVPPLHEQLPMPLREKVRGTLRLEMRATLADVEAHALPMLGRLRAEDAADAADRLVGAARGDAMAVAGLRDTRNALKMGQAMELVLDPAQVGDADRTEKLVRLAAETDARIRFATDHPGLREHGGAGALLRFRLDRPVDGPVTEAHRQPGQATVASGSRLR